jgi:uncharacterized Zn-binding protein involved in type VI secretion
MPLAARVGDTHSCPMPGPPPSGLPPHAIGMIQPPGAPTVTIGGPFAALFGDMIMCTPPNPPATIIQGSISVKIGGKMAARQTDKSSHGGSILAGCPTVTIGGPTSGGVLKPTCTDPKLSAFMNQLYRPHATFGNGGTADSVRYTKITGFLIGGSDHVQKAQGAIVFLNKCAARLAGTPDAAAATQVATDLARALLGL